MINPSRLDPGRAMLLVIDVQEKLLELIRGRERVVEAARMLIDGGAVFELPVLVTEQYPEGIGGTNAQVAACLQQVAAPVVTKLSFSCCGDDGFMERLRALDREQIVVAGIEAHVCVQQTALDLVRMDYQVVVCADAVGSRFGGDYTAAMHRLRHAGVQVTTVESALFELCGACGSETFKRMLPIIKRPRCDSHARGS